jgi:hypothetical protein
MFKFKRVEADRIVTIDNLMISPWKTQTALNFDYADMYCKFLDIGGYQDWRLPTYPELCVIYKNKFKLGVLNTSTVSVNINVQRFRDVFYSSNVSVTGEIFCKSLEDGTKLSFFDHNIELGVRAVRLIGDK